MPDEPTNGRPSSSENGNSTSQDMSDSDFEAMQELYEQLGRDYEEIDETFARQIDSSLKKRGGDRLPELMRSPEDTIRCFADPDDVIRELAIELAVFHWRIGHQIADRCERMALADPAIVVRSAAISALGTCYRGQRDGASRRSARTNCVRSQFVTR